MSTQPMPEMAPLLRTLRLSGILDTISRRNKEAIDKKLPYTEFLALLLQDELLRRENKKFAELIRQSGCHTDKTIESFDFHFNPKINQPLIKDLATGAFITEKAPVLIVGPCGTGKSHLAQALGHCAIRRKEEVILTTQTQMSQELTTAQAMGTYQKVYKRFIKTRVLIIDDFGLTPLKSPQDEHLHDVIAQRYEQHSTIVTSNLDISEWSDAFPNKLLGAATIDRLQHNAYLVTLEGKSYRSIKKQK